MFTLGWDKDSRPKTKNWKWHFCGTTFLSDVAILDSRLYSTQDVKLKSKLGSYLESTRYVKEFFETQIS